MLNADVCGGWERRVEIPSDKSRYGTIDEVSEANQRVLRDIFTGPYPASPPTTSLPDPTDAVDRQNFEKLQDAYDACLNESAIEELGADPLLSILQNVVAKYPAESKCHPIEFQVSGKPSNSHVNTIDCSETEGSLTSVIEYLLSIGVGALFSLVVSVTSLPLCVPESGRRMPRTPMSISCLSIKTAQDSQARTIIRTKEYFEIMKPQFMIHSPLFLESKEKSSSLMRAASLISKRF
jgi:Peptidase family M13